ncbi:MAG TPA: FtsQ-type POTRA domain-containing protein [Acidimicrobiales bacterium]
MNMQVRPPIDPRIRKRRIAVRREEGRRRLRLLIGIASVTGVLIGGWGATRSPLLDVDGFDVTGASQTSRDELIAASGIRFGQAMVDVDERGAVDALVALPWVASASVERRWPDSVVIQVVERDPVAAAPAEDGWALVDATGQVLALLASAPSNLLALDGIAPAGPPGSHLGGPAADLLAVAAAVPPDLRPRVSAVLAAPEGGVELRLQPEGTVRLGAPQQLAEKFRAALTVLGQVDTQALATLDVRIPESPVLTRLNPVGNVSPLGTG